MASVAFQLIEEVTAHA